MIVPDWSAWVFAVIAIVSGLIAIALTFVVRSKVVVYLVLTFFFVGFFAAMWAMRIGVVTPT